MQSDPDEVQIILQKVQHPGWVHLDIETDDIEAEVARLEQLGAKRVAQIKNGWVMEAPGGHGHCLVQPASLAPPFERYRWQIHSPS